ncbi:MAG TPA: UTP--glucose-1-phosphate uridylyltransferase [Candidatus Bathyarchaeia archaeon]|nr:UTP--glucose-1-phosphate uridylyltransferase [Candidatus Bathyarchaeia archaeon]
MNPFIETITSTDPALRDRPFRDLCSRMTPAELVKACAELDRFRRGAENLYERVRASLFLYAAHRFFLQECPEFPPVGKIPYKGFEDLLARRFEEAIDAFQGAGKASGPNAAVFSALAEAYHHLTFQTLTDQVRRSVRASRGNQWMFRVGHPGDHPVRVRPEMLERPNGTLLFPMLVETTPVRLDLSHSGWSDIFFLGMDYPEGARVLNISVDLGVYGRHDTVQPPIESSVRAIAEPVLRLTSIDLETTKDITDLRDLFNFGNDYLSLLKAGVIASGLVPPSFEGTSHSVAAILAAIVGPGMGIELVTRVNDIPKGSRLAVSTNLLASIISVLMRATGQTAGLTGPLAETERRLAASRAILGEWLGGSGGGWQDSGGIWPGFKVIEGAVAGDSDPEWGISRGCLLPRHRVLGDGDLHPDVKARLASSLVLIHGGMAQNVGPILEMVTEKYLLRAAAEWRARSSMRRIFDNILEALRDGDVQAIGRNTTQNFQQPLNTIIPWVTNQFTETIIRGASEKFGGDFWGFLMLGGMSGGGMAMFVNPSRREEFRESILGLMRSTKSRLEDVLPFAMDPVVYNFEINGVGSVARLLSGDDAIMPAGYYALQIPELVRQNPQNISYLRRVELDHFTARPNTPEQTYQMLRTTVSNLFRVSDPATQTARMAWDAESDEIKRHNGFDVIQHEQIRADLRNGRIGLAHNRLPVDTTIEDIQQGDTVALEEKAAWRRLGEKALRDGRVAVLSLAAGVGSRWTTGAGVIKAINPFIQLAGRHRSFLEIHVAKTRRVAGEYGKAIPHIVSTSFLTHGPIEKHIGLNKNYGYEGPLVLSPGRAIGQRLIPMVRDLVFLWEEMPQETLDEQKQKVREAVRGALMDWAQSKGEGNDYVDNVPIQRFNPPGHWYEIPNLFRNGVLAGLIEEYPNLETIMLHNIDTLGADLDPLAIGAHLDGRNLLTFEVVPRRIDDRGGGLARVNGKVRLLEGLAQPREEDELKLSYYNSMTTWIQIDPLLELFGLERKDLSGPQEHIVQAVRQMAQRMPTYVTIKDVKRRWGHGQEDVYPVAQFEKLWSDMTGLPDVRCGYLAVPRLRGQQLKDYNQLDAWANDGSKEYVAKLSGLEE